MDFVIPMIDMFWAVGEQAIQLLVPIIAIILLFKIVGKLLFGYDR